MECGICVCVCVRVCVCVCVCCLARGTGWLKYFEKSEKKFRNTKDDNIVGTGGGKNLILKQLAIQLEMLIREKSKGQIVLKPEYIILIVLPKHPM